MDDLMDMIIGDESPSKISDEIKNMLFNKSAEKINSTKPEIANSMFSGIVNSNEE
jgi:hypothetical protein